MKAETEPIPDVPRELRLFSVRETAKILRVTENAVRKLIHGGELEACRVGVLLRVSQAALESYLDENQSSGPDSRRDPRGGRSTA